MFRQLDTFPATLHQEQPARTEDVTEIQDADTGDLLCYAPPNQAERLMACADACRFMERDPVEVLGQVHAFLADVRLKLSRNDLADLDLEGLLAALGPNPALALAA